MKFNIELYIIQVMKFFTILFLTEPIVTSRY